MLIDIVVFLKRVKFVVRVIKSNEINAFINFGDSLNKVDLDYVPYIRGDLKRTIKHLVFEKKSYKAICSFDDNGKINGRILLTVKRNKQLNTEKCGCFSHIEVVNDYNVFKELIDFSIATLKEMGAQYIMGPFFPHDPDNRRGVLVEGFEYAPMIFTSQNLKYYKDLFEQYGFEKLTDALEYEYCGDEQTEKRICEIAQKALVENDIHINKVDITNPDRDIEDVHRIMEIASTNINFEHVISKEEIAKIFKSWKLFLEPDFILIARSNKDDSPIGFTMAIPNYYDLIRKMNGRLNLRGLCVFLFCRKQIKGLRAMLQYIIPEYQHKGVSKALYWETKKAVDKHKIQRISLGTIMEKNGSSNGSILSLGGKLSRVYRIYYKAII